MNCARELYVWIKFHINCTRPFTIPVCVRIVCPQYAGIRVYQHWVGQ